MRGMRSMRSMRGARVLCLANVTKHAWYAKYAKYRGGDGLESGLLLCVIVYCIITKYAWGAKCGWYAKYATYAKYRGDRAGWWAVAMCDSLLYYYKVCMRC